ncbi:hypothetical protein IWQ62_005421, partial [Dispira parvispora]
MSGGWLTKRTYKALFAVGLVVFVIHLIFFSNMITKVPDASHSVSDAVERVKA